MSRIPYDKASQWAGCGLSRDVIEDMIKVPVCEVGSRLFVPDRNVFINLTDYVIVCKEIYWWVVTEEVFKALYR